MENRPGNTFSLSRRIGSTTYITTVHLSEDATESYEEKILRMIRNEADTNGQECGTMEAPLMSRQSGRSA